MHLNKHLHYVYVLKCPLCYINVYTEWLSMLGGQGCPRTQLSVINYRPVCCSAMNQCLKAVCTANSNVIFSLSLCTEYVRRTLGVHWTILANASAIKWRLLYKAQIHKRIAINFDANIRISRDDFGLSRWAAKCCDAKEM